MATDKANTDAVKDSTTRVEGDVLKIQDVLSGIAPEAADAGTLGAYLIFETVGNNTVVSVDIVGAGHKAPVQIITLPNITGMTLQDLLNDTQSGA